MLRVLLFREDDVWIAQALEVDLSAQGRTEEKALQNLRATLVLQAKIDVRANRRPFSRSREAEPRYFDLFKKAEPWSSPAEQPGDGRPSELLPEIGEIRAAA